MGAYTMSFARYHRTAKQASKAALPVALVALASCTGENAVADPPAPPVGGYLVNLTADSIDGRIHIAGTTNLPELTMVRLSATRVFVATDGDPANPQGATLGSAVVPVVAGGIIDATFTLDESLLEIPLFDEDAIIETVSPLVSACASVETGKDGDEHRQSESVRALLGNDGEALAGSPDAYVFGSLTDTPSTWLEVGTTLAIEPRLQRLAEVHGKAPEVAALPDFCL